VNPQKPLIAAELRGIRPEEIKSGWRHIINQRFRKITTEKELLLMSLITKRLKILAFAVAFIAIFSSSASADLLYLVYNSGEASTASAGTIAGDGYLVSKDLVVGLGGDAKAYSFKDHNGVQKALVREYSYGANDNVFIYTLGQWTPDKNENTFGTNIYGTATIGRYLYTITYESYEAGAMASGQVIRVDMANGYAPDKTYDLKSYEGEDGTQFFRSGVGIKAWDGKIYAVTAVHDESFMLWEAGEVIELDQDLNPTGRTAAIGKNAGGGMADSGISINEGKLYVGCYGGALGSETPGDYWEVDLTSMTSEKIIDLGNEALDLDKAYGGYSVTIAPDGTAFLLLTNYDASYNMTIKLYVTSVAEMSQGSIGREAQPFGEKTGYSWGLLYDDKTETLWCMAGTDLEARAKDGSIKKIFTPADLGDDIYSIALIDSAGSSSGGPGSSSGGGGGGCNAGFAFLALLVCPAFLVSRKCR
jgi:hypothetical protein